MIFIEGRIGPNEIQGMKSEVETKIFLPTFQVWISICPESHKKNWFFLSYLFFAQVRCCGGGCGRIFLFLILYNCSIFLFNSFEFEDHTLRISDVYMTMSYYDKGQNLKKKKHSMVSTWYIGKSSRGWPDLTWPVVTSFRRLLTF